MDNASDWQSSRGIWDLYSLSQVASPERCKSHNVKANYNWYFLNRMLKKEEKQDFDIKDLKFNCKLGCEYCVLLSLLQVRSL